MFISSSNLLQGGGGGQGGYGGGQGGYGGARVHMEEAVLATTTR